MSSLQVDTAAGQSASAHRPDHDGLSHMWPPNSPDINTEDYAIQQRVYHQRQLKTVEELKRAIVTEWQKLSQRFIDITASMNAVDVLKLLSRIAADTSSIATWLKQPHIILILSRDKLSQ